VKIIGNKNGLNDRPHPGPLLRGEGETFARLWNVVRLDWLDNFSPTRNLAAVCPLLGERKQVREDVKTNQQPRNTQNTRTRFSFRVFSVVRGSIWDGQPAAAGAMSGA
jgi:hypothetical protein